MHFTDQGSSLLRPPPDSTGISTYAVQPKGHRWEILGFALCHSLNGVADGFLTLGTNRLRYIIVDATSHHIEAGRPVSCSSTQTHSMIVQ